MADCAAQQLCTQSWSTRELFEDFPPRWMNSNKKFVFSISTPIETIHTGVVTYSRWAEITLPRNISMSHENSDNSPLSCRIEIHKKGYQYEPVPDSIYSWHVNFADRELFGFYGGPLFAQDEMQVVEHPVLACVREAAIYLRQRVSPNFSPVTQEDGRCTPVLIRGAQRRVRLNTSPDPELKRPKGLYGNEFMNSSKETIELACNKLDPPTVTNIIAIEAPKNCSGEYTLSTISQILKTAYTAFMAAKIESHTASHEKGQTNPPDIVIHTGHWGTGAFGGNKTLMALLQITAAHLARVHKIVYWALDDAQSVLDAIIIINDLLRAPGESDGNIPLSKYLNTVQEKKFRWGLSNGT